MAKEFTDEEMKRMLQRPANPFMVFLGGLTAVLFMTALLLGSVGLIVLVLRYLLA